MKMILASVLTAAVAITSAPRYAHANQADENFLCPAKWGMLWLNYLSILELGKSTGKLTDRLQAHGVLNDLLADRSNPLLDLMTIIPNGEVALFAIRNADERCLKAGVDKVFGDDAPPQPPTETSTRVDNGGDRGNRGH